ncbi:MAG: hypothetical protein Q7S42_04345 [Candidatus Omnitrophota bacterium]|nr:hypothetical protein [Candidatus Omnitrophota bacterium]
MMKRRSGWMACGYEPVCIGGYWTFMPLFCQTQRHKRIVSHKRRSR